jgi:hypothetical protein
MHRRIGRGCLIALVLAGVAAPERGGRRETLISSVVVSSNPVLVEDDCNAYPTTTYPGVDAKRWPTDGKYECPNNGPHAFIGANPNPLIATGYVICMYSFRTCDPEFGTPSTGSDQQGPFATVSAASRVLTLSGCETGSPTYFASRTQAVYDTSALCQSGGGGGGGGGDECESCTNYNVSGPGDCSEDGGYYIEECHCCVEPWSPILIDVAGNGLP